ncbi:MAG: hypothetical protein ABSC33_00710 [Candidatus Sulfotelmatobacter sp.]|jgi:hypothetical protein
MSYESQLLPSSDGETPRRLTVETLWGNLPEDQSENLQGMKLLRSWLVYDSENQDSKNQNALVSGHRNKARALGLSLAIGFSASIWMGIGWMIASSWK